VGGRDVTDWWQYMSGGLRQYLRGWSKNLGTEQKLQKLHLLDQIKQLDDEADAIGLEEDWAFRYYLEYQLLNIYRIEEEYWRQRGGIRWSLQGDANTAYFHAVANGRRRKCLISNLVTEDGPISDKLLMQQHIYAFYRELLGSVAPPLCGLAPDSWDGLARVNQAENLNLAPTFSEIELFEIVKEMKTYTAPGSDGFQVAFFQKCWPLVKHGVLPILNDFILGRIDIARLNYGVLSLIPKTTGAEKISQYI
jgi:mannosylglycoprotein endo-beta-mannosidase